MKRKPVIVGVLCVLIGVAGLVWFSGMYGQPWRTGPSGPRAFFGGTRWMHHGGTGMIGAYGGPGWMMSPNLGLPNGKSTFASNEEQIYYTGISQKTGPIPRTGGPMWVNHTGVGCLACHGVQGSGGVPVMMGTAIPEDIRYATLVAAEHHEDGEEKEEMNHAPYTDATIERAITQGVNPANKPLDWTMPRWQMAAEDLNDLLVYLKTLR